MGIFDIFRGPQPAPEVKESPTVGKTLLMSGADVKWSKRDYAAFAKESYEFNVIAYAAVRKMQQAIGSIPWEIVDDQGGEVKGNSPLRNLMRRPNPQQSTAAFMQQSTGYLLLSGNLYTEAITPRSNPEKVQRLYTHRPDRMSIVGGNRGLPKRFVYTGPNGATAAWPVNQINGQSKILHTKFFNPLDDWYGLSPIEPAAYSVDQHNESMKWMQALLQNSARPSGALRVGEGRELGDDEFGRLQSMIEEVYAGSANAGRPMLLEGGLDWVQMGLTPRDLEVIMTKNAAARDIALAIGVPPQLLGIPGDNTYSNFQEARLAFWEDSVLPLTEYIVEEYNYWLGPHFDGHQLRPNFDLIPAIVERRRRLWNMADKSTDLTVNERRAIKGYGELEDGEVREPVAGPPQDQANTGGTNE